jgi:hypothetical protein
MAKFRADFDVKGSLVLPVGEAELSFRSADRNTEITLSNRHAEGAEHANGLVACVVAEADDIGKVVDHFRTLLARQLDLLTFVTQSGFEIDQCRRVIDWEPHQKKRRIRPLQRFDRFDPPDPDLGADFLATAEAFAQARPAEYTLRALRSFRQGVIGRQLDDQFEHFWHVIETIAEGSKEPLRAPIPCPICQQGLFCPNCNDTPTRRPVARQAIRELLGKIRKDGDKKFYSDLVRTRDHLLHGRPPEDVVKVVGIELDRLVDEVGAAAWQCILSVMPKLPGSPSLAHRDWQFAFKVLAITPDMEFEYDGVAPHPSEAQIPKVTITLHTRFRPRSDGPSE